MTVTQTSPTVNAAAAAAAHLMLRCIGDGDGSKTLDSNSARVPRSFSRKISPSKERPLSSPLLSLHAESMKGLCFSRAHNTHTHEHLEKKQRQRRRRKTDFQKHISLLSHTHLHEAKSTRHDRETRRRKVGTESS